MGSMRRRGSILTIRSHREQSVENLAGFPEVDFHTDRDILTLAAEFVWSLDNDLSVTSITGYMDGEDR